MKKRATRLLALFLSATMAASPVANLRAETLETTETDAADAAMAQAIAETEATEETASKAETSPLAEGATGSDSTPVSENIPAATDTVTQGGTSLNTAAGEMGAEQEISNAAAGEMAAEQETSNAAVGEMGAEQETSNAAQGEKAVEQDGWDASTGETIEGQETSNAGVEDSAVDQKVSSTISGDATTEQNGSATQSTENIVNNLDTTLETVRELSISLLSTDESESAVQLLKKDGTAFKMFVISSSSTTVVDDKIQITMETKNVSYNKIYLGNASDEVKDPVIEGVDTGSGYIFTFEVPITDAGQQIPIALCKKSDSAWSSQELVLTVPAVSSETETPTPTETPVETPTETRTPTETPAETPEESVEIEGFQVIKTEDNSEFKMFVIDSYTSEVSGDVMKITITTSNSGYNKIYLGLVTDEVKEPVIEGVSVGEGYSFTFELPVSAAGTLQPISLWSKSKGQWYTSKELALSIPADAAKSEDEENEAPTPSVPADGDYSTTVESSAAMFKVIDCVLTSKNGEMTATITLSGTGYDYLYLGSAENAENGTEADWISYVPDMAGKYTFTLPVSALDTPIAVAAHSARKNEWYDRELTFKSEDLKRILENGKYTAEVESSASMFKVIDCVLTSFNGELVASITLSGTGYDTLYMGSAEAAANADAEDIITYVLDEDGQYVFTIPVTELDAPIAVAAHSVRKDEWYDRTLTFKSDSLIKIDDDADEDGSDDTENTGGTAKPDTGNTGGTAKPDTTPDTESKYESDTSGSTSAVNSATSLPDGVYTPDRFNWSGGSGRVSLSCNKVTVTNGQAYATIVFDSDAYSYVKANGRTYYGSNGGGTSTFVIPIELNKNNTILGMTTKMSASHEVAYSIFVYIAAAANADGGLTENGNNELDEEAPQIMGLEYDSETELEYAEYFKIFHYQDGITLLEIDMTKDTARDPEKMEDTKEIIADESELTAEDGEEVVQTDEEIGAELYKGNIVKYLIVPEDVEIPVGLDKEMIVIQLPADNAYVASEEALSVMDELELLEQIAAIGFEAEDCELEEIATAMEEEEILFAGTYEEPDYKALLKAKTNLVVLPDEILPIDEEDEITERLATLGIPVIVDRSEDEEEELAKREWIKVYGVLFGCEEIAEKLFEAAVEEE